MSRPLFTVFTPTYNRAHTLDRVYHSLLLQTFKDFEWLIVDDGSNDGTAALVHGFINEGRLAIRYLQQRNSGKHVAFNHGVQEARGELFLTLDSDDACVPNALERFDYFWQSIPLVERVNYSGIGCLCMSAAGKIVGTRFPATIIDTNLIDLAIRHKVVGEKWGFHRTTILKQYPFPVFDGERFSPEGLVWNRIGQKFKLRFVDEPLRIYEYMSDGLTANIIRLRAQNPRGVRLYYFEYMKLAIPVIHKWKAIINYFRFTAHSKISIIISLKEINRTPGYIFLLIAGYLLYIDDCRTLKKLRN
jgi:glycosyltransferase involved in cell wall biosynthesis